MHSSLSGRAAAQRRAGTQAWSLAVPWSDSGILPGPKGHSCSPIDDPISGTPSTERAEACAPASTEEGMRLMPGPLIQSTPGLIGLTTLHDDHAIPYGRTEEPRGHATRTQISPCPGRSASGPRPSDHPAPGCRKAPAREVLERAASQSTSPPTAACGSMGSGSLRGHPEMGGLGTAGRMRSGSTKEPRRNN
jgi:hypothetical protein